MKRLMYAIPLSAIAVLMFAAIAVAQDDVPKSQQQGQGQGQAQSPIAADANTTGVRNSTTVPAKETPEETTTPTESTAPASSSPTTVDINDNAFNPDQLNITPGTTVRFFNNGTGPHTATAKNDLFDTGELKPGDSFEVYFEGAGTVKYHDALNPNMEGSILVGEGLGGENTATQKREAQEAPNSEPSSEEDEHNIESTKPAED